VLKKHYQAAYYAAVAPAILPHLASRPITMFRCPSGVAKTCFFQKHPGRLAPKSLRQIRVREKAATGRYFIVDDVAGLVSLVQIGVLEIHAWGAKTDDLDHPDRIVFDLDPAPDVLWARTVAGAAEIRDRLAAFGLKSFVKTSGGKGLHVIAPLAPVAPWAVVKAFAKELAAAMAHDAPSAYTTALPKAERVGRIFIDYLRNERGATAVAPYAPRARPGAPVSTPLAWSELKPDLAPAAFNVHTVPSRLVADPWAGMTTLRQTIPDKALRRLGLAG
jgi:bifunctional non-homologous end joining protein LigD